MAKGSCGETRSQLYVALDQNYIAREVFTAISKQAQEVSRMISGLMKHLQRSTLKGHKYKKRS
ncbi:MAG: four helix bundle protein [Acidobacteriota bacterium]